VEYLTINMTSDAMKRWTKSREVAGNRVTLVRILPWPVSHYYPAIRQRDSEKLWTPSMDDRYFKWDM